MSQPEDRTSDVDMNREETQSPPPALGLVAEEDPAVLENILEARRHGLDVFVISPDEGETTTASVAQELGCDVFTPFDSNVSLDVLHQYLAIQASSTEANSIIIPSDSTMLIDIGETLNKQAFDDVVTDAVYKTGDVRILVGIPAYNEEDRVGDVVSKAKQYADQVIVIDDASVDQTVEKARSAGATVISHAENRGYGGALKTAFEEAKKRDAEHLIILDGDGQHDPNDIPKIIETQQETDSEIVIGSRFEKGSETKMPLYRRFGLSIVNSLTNLSMGVISRNSWVKDTQSGFRAYNRRAIESLSSDDSLGYGMSASTDILYHAHQQQYELEEVGTTIDYDVTNPSSHNPLTHGLTLISNILKTIERERPIMTLGVPGFVSAFAGLGLGYWTFSNYITTGVFPMGLAITSAFFGLAGIFASFTAIILHSLNTHLDSHVQ